MIKTFVALGLNSGLVYVAGFGFWFLCAKVLSSESVGSVVTFFALINTAASFGLLGLNTVIIRFLAGSEQREHLVGQSLVLTGVMSMLIVLVVNFLFFKTTYHPILCMLGAVFTCWNSLSDNILLGLGKSKQLVLKNILGTTIKLGLLLLFTLVIQVTDGPVWAIVLGAVAAVFWVGLMFRTNLKSVIVRFRNFTYVARYKTYAFGSYVSHMINNLPGYIVPVLVSNYYQFSGTAHYFMAANIANTAFIVPQLTTTSLFSEGSRNEKQLHTLLIRAIRLTFLILVPICVVLFVIPGQILDIFGSTYRAEGALILRLFALSGPFVGINYLAGTWLYLQNRVRTLVVINLWQTAILLVLTTWFLIYGLWGAGLAALITQVVSVGIYSVIFVGSGRKPKSFLNQFFGLIKKLIGQYAGPSR